MNEEDPSSSSESKTDAQLNASTQKTISQMVENAERAINQERNADQERYRQARIRQREREMRLQNMVNDRPRPGDGPFDDPYDSSESGYWSINDRRPKTKYEQMWDRIRARERRLLEQKERQRVKEEKQELDAIFHIMLHGDGSDELLVSNGSEYEFKLPEYMKFDEIQRGFDEQMKIENANRILREEAEKKRCTCGRKGPKIEEEEPEPTPSNYIKDECGPAFRGYNFPPINTDWNNESNYAIKKEENPEPMDDIDMDLYVSSDEEDKSDTAITERAMKVKYICMLSVLKKTATNQGMRVLSKISNLSRNSAEKIGKNSSLLGT